jgi:DNA-directed RNA polymerase subunit RPC12/RpoP
MNFNYEDIKDAIENGLGEGGDLVLAIYCMKCGAEFAIDREAATIAILTESKFIDYLRKVQSSKCPICGKK